MNQEGNHYHRIFIQDKKDSGQDLYYQKEMHPYLYQDSLFEFLQKRLLPQWHPSHIYDHHLWISLGAHC